MHSKGLGKVRRTDLAWMVGLVVVLTALLLASGCRSEEPLREVPDLVVGMVVDSDTGAGLVGVSVGILINEREFVPTLGPEGTTRPQIRQRAGAVTDASGRFSIDLMGVKRDLAATFPKHTLTMRDLHLSKKGYETLFATYSGPGQQLKLKKAS